MPNAPPPTPPPPIPVVAGTGVNVNGASFPPRAPANITPPTIAANAGINRGFTPDQLSILRNQIFSFKLLTKNVGVPPSVKQQLYLPQQRTQPSPTAKRDVVVDTTPGPTLDHSTPVHENHHDDKDDDDAAVGGVGAGAGASMPPTKYESFTSPYAHVPKHVAGAEHDRRLQRTMIPSIMPVGLDPDRVREERERVVYNRILARRAELEKLPTNLTAWEARSRKGARGPDGASPKLKALIEYKMLGLLPKQRALRQRVARTLLQSDHLAMSSNRAMCRRMKKQSYREARVTEKLEKMQRDARENREKQKHADYLHAVLQHGREIQTGGASQRARVQKLGRMMLQHHQYLEKEEQKRIERTAKQRLQALRSDDEVTYLRLLSQAKDTRITHLLHQTDGFLKQLAASVKQQQRTAERLYGHDDTLENGVHVDNEDANVDAADQDDDDESGEGGKIDYYEVAHRIKEEVTRQPSMLVGGHLKEYQLKGLQWMISLYNNNLNGILADEMGLGKTIQTISLITYLVEMKNQHGPFLVIVPLSTLTNWNNEFEKWAPTITRVLYKGPPAVRKSQAQNLRYEKFHVLLTTYEFIIKDRHVLSKIKWMHMIVDEGHRMKNSQSKLSHALTTYYHTRYRLILTGTPLQNNLPELWALLNFVLPTIFKSVKSFDEWFNTPFANTGNQDKMELTEEEQLLVIRRLHKVLRPFLLRRLKKDVEKDLPEKQERVVKCVFSALQAKLYKQMMTHQKIMIGDGKGGKTGIRGLSNMLMQLRKLCNHPFAFPEIEDQINPSRSIDDSLWRTAGKFELLDRILPKFQATGHRVLMFFQMTNIMNIMEDYMKYKGMNCLRLDGTTKSDDRSELLRLFNAPESPYFCFLLSTRAGGLGLNLQTADTVIIYDSDWNPHQDLQAQDRAHRIGQKNEVRILRLISANSIEEKILERAQYKLDMDGKVIQAGKFDNKSTNEEREALLRTLMDTAEASESLDQEEMDDDDLNLMMSRSSEEYELFRRMDEERERDGVYGPTQPLPRLMTEAELPEIYLTDGNPVVEPTAELVGRGARQRNQVKYDDGLTEEQWLDAVDAEDDTVEDAMARKDARIAKRQANKDRRSKGGPAAAAMDDSPDPSRDGSEQPLGRRGRPGSGRQSKAEKRKAEEATLEEEMQQGRRPSKRNKRGRQSNRSRAATATATTTTTSSMTSDPLSAQERAAHQKVMQSVFKSLMDLEAPPESDDDDDDDDNGGAGGRPIIDPFVHLPSKKLYPDYYMVIPHPISMDQIKKKINKGDYLAGWKDFRDDVLRLCNNARTYNEDGSILFQDANTVEAELNVRLKEQLAIHPIADDQGGRGGGGEGEEEGEGGDGEEGREGEEEEEEEEDDDDNDNDDEEEEDE